MFGNVYTMSFVGHGNCAILRVLQLNKSSFDKDIKASPNIYQTEESNRVTLTSLTSREENLIVEGDLKINTLNIFFIFGRKIKDRLLTGD